jgi:hypothetical protein
MNEEPRVSSIGYQPYRPSVPAKVVTVALRLLPIAVIIAVYWGAIPNELKWTLRSWARWPVYAGRYAEWWLRQPPGASDV